jgi:hypothetical protein
MKGGRQDAEKSVSSGPDSPLSITPVGNDSLAGARLSFFYDANDSDKQIPNGYSA